MQMTFRTLSEGRPGSAWRSVFATGWPGWQAWLRARRTGNAPALAESERALRQHMPEFAPVWERLIETVEADEEAATFLTFWTPPRYLGQCAQAVIPGDAPVLVRNYDLDPRLNEATLLKTDWLRPVIGMVEGLSGLADGINGDGLAISLAYGGRRIIGEGFGVPLTMRYVLETCSDVPEGVEALRAIPHHMSYNLTLLDRAGRHATVMIAPDREIIISDARYATNHQMRVEDARHAEFCNTVERADRLRDLLTAGPDRIGLIEAFQSAPLYNTQFEAGFGTVYTSVYDTAQGGVALVWPGQARWRHSFEDFRIETRSVTYEPPTRSDSSSTEWMRYVPLEVRRYVLLGMTDAA